MTTTINFTLYYSRANGRPFLDTFTMVEDKWGNTIHQHRHTVVCDCDYEVETMWKTFRNFRNETADSSREFQQTLNEFKTLSVTKVWRE